MFFYQDQAKYALEVVIGSPPNILKVSDTILDDLIKGMKDLSLEVARLSKVKAFQSWNVESTRRRHDYHYQQTLGEAE